MEKRFYQVNNKVLSFDITKDMDKIVFNHYLIRKENKERRNQELLRGQFRLSSRVAASELSISRHKARALLNFFIEREIISVVSLGTNDKTMTIYSYLSSEESAKSYQPADSPANIPVDEPSYHPDLLDIEISDFNSLNKSDIESIQPVDRPTDNPANQPENDPYKKELLKRFNKNIYCQIVEALNYATRKNFKSSSKKTRNLINARLNDGFVVEDFEKVIKIKSAQWLDTPMAIYLRPETLFSSKFESYLNEGLSEKATIDTGTDTGPVTPWCPEFTY